jgi:signal recognition particle subunit SRP54
MFDSIKNTLDSVFSGFRKRGKLTEDNIKEGMRQIRRALLEADVNIEVAREFVKTCTEKAIGQEIVKSVQPTQQIVKIVHDELVALMGAGDPSLPQSNGDRPGVMMMLGLQGSGKTTSSAKLARMAKKKGRNPLLVAADMTRPAAIKQLQVLGEQIEVPVFTEDFTPPRVCRMGVKHAQKNGYDLVILDTAGRLHIDDVLMEELEKVAAKCKPDQRVLVANAMTGQDAVNSAAQFNERLGIDGVILTMMDGDARGGAALTIRKIAGCPIKFIGVGERIDGLEEYHPNRLANTILGMGDIVGLVEKAQTEMDQEKAVKMQEKIRKATFTLEDMLEQFQQLRKMGPLGDLLSKIPGFGDMMGGEELDESEFARAQAIIQSMTPYERSHPDVIDGRRRRRVAAGSGVTVQDVNGLLKEFKHMRKMMKKAKKRGGGLLAGLGIGR